MNEVPAAVDVPRYYKPDMWKRWAHKYDCVTGLCFIPFGGQKRFRESFVELGGIKDGDMVLDVCCGTGATTAPIARMVGTGKVTGVDLSPDMMDRAKTKVSGLNAEFVRASIASLPFADNSFDKAFISYALHEMPDDIRQAGLKEIHRVLKPGGRFLALDYHRSSAFPWRQGITAFVRFIEEPQAYFFFRLDWKAQIEQPGFKTITTRLPVGGMFQIVVAEKV